MKRNGSRIIPTFVLCLVVGCGGAGEDEGEMVGEISGALKNKNALNPNALNPNVLDPSSFNSNALDPNALDPGLLSAEFLSAIQDPGTPGDYTRTLVKFIVGCALDSSQSFSFTWTDAQGVAQSPVHWGILGLAPEWGRGPLSAAQQRWISACLASRANLYGASVTISSRGPHPLLESVDSAEHDEFPVFEGAFFGDLFAPTPVLHACFFPPSVGHAQSLMRACASGQSTGVGGITECGPIHVIGPCQSHCSGWSSEGYYTNCQVGGASYDEVVTTFLP